METRIGRRGLFLAIAFGAAALTGACMTGNPPQQTEAAHGGRQCFLPSEVNGFHALNEETVHVTVGASSIYELKLVGSCPQIDWSQRIGIRSTIGGSWVCQGHDAELIVPGPLGLQRCQVSSVRRLSPEEVKAARATRKP